MSIKFADTTKVVKKSTASLKVESRAQPFKGSVVDASLRLDTGSAPTAPSLAGTQALPVDTPSKSLFDRNKYQREYMRDKRSADKLGISVKEFRAQKQGQAK